MQEQRHEADDLDSNNYLRLEDITRRSACDRCRGMKTRCERSHHRGLNQLTQCRRCAQAQVKCTTTLECQPQRTTQQGDRPSEKRHRKKQWRRESSADQGLGFVNMKSLPSLSTCTQPQNTISLGDPEPAQDPGPDNLARSRMMPSPAERLMEPPGALGQWPELVDFFNLHDDDAAHDREYNNSSADADPALMDIIPTRSPPSDSTYHGTLLDPALTPTQNLPLNGTGQAPCTTTDCQIVQDELAMPSPYTTSEPHMSPRESKSVMDRLLEFNAELLQDLQSAKGPGLARKAGQLQERATGSPVSVGILLSQALSHSERFLLLIREITQECRRGSREQGAAADGAAGEIDTEVVLQVLSCILGIKKLYESLNSALTKWQASSYTKLNEVRQLPGLSVEGLQSMDKDLQLSLLVHASAHMLARIEDELRRVRSQGSLTLVAHTTLQVVLGEDDSIIKDSVRHSPEVGNLKQLAMSIRQVG